MIQDTGKSFDNQYRNEIPTDEDYVFVCRGYNPKTEILGDIDGGVSFPKVRELNVSKEDLRYLFEVDGKHFFLYMGKDTKEFGNYHFHPTKILRTCNPVELCFAGMTAIHLYSWYENHRCCGRCGHKMVHHDTLRALKCPECGNLTFPVISPCVIAGVRNGDSICISYYGDREYKGRALIAGYIEIGETPEDAVRREVMEEVGLKVKNIQYFGSQPWGFDSNLLLGYFCDLDGDDTITLDQNELSSARFVRREDLGTDDNLLALTGTMIEEFRKGNF